MQLVDRKRLHETVAMYRLEEAERRLQQEQENATNDAFCKNKEKVVLTDRGQEEPIPTSEHAEENINGDFNKQVEATSSVPLPPADPILPTSTMTSFLESKTESHPTTIMGDVPPPTEKVVLPPASLTVIEEKSAIPQERASLLADLVKMDTESLRAAVPLEKVRAADMKERRRNRRKSVSDGVALMAALGKPVTALPFGMSNAATTVLGKSKDSPTSGSVNPDAKPLAGDKLEEEPSNQTKFTVDDSALLKRKERRRNRKKAVSASAAIQQMRDYTGDEVDLENPEPAGAVPTVDLESMTKIDGSEKRGSLGLNIFKRATDDTSAAVLTWRERRARQRANMKKSLSASSAVRQMRDGEQPMDEFLHTADDVGAKKGPLGIPTVQQTAKKILTSSDDSSAATSVLKERRARRAHGRKKSLSASAAIKLMRDYGDTDDDVAAMNDFWHSPGIGSELPPIHEKDSHAKPQQVSTSPEHGGMFLSGQAVVTDNISEMCRMTNTGTSMGTLHEGDHEEVSERSGFLSDHKVDSTVGGELRIKPMNSYEPETALFGSKSNQDEDSGIMANGDGDESTVDTAGSVGGLSDVDEYSNENMNMLYYRHYDEDENFWDKYSCSSLFSRFHNSAKVFFMGKSYSFITHMVGTMLALFLVGMRVEGFLQVQCIIPHDDNSWDFDLIYSFWLLFAFQACFIVISFGQVFLFCPCLQNYQADDMTEDRQEHWSIFLAALIDVGICGLCMVLLCIAEFNRCCHGDEVDSYSYNLDGQEYHRFLAGEKDESYSTACEDSTLLCTCPPYGERVEGGIGQIEPFVSLIALRVFRFLVAVRIVQQFNLGKELREQDDDPPADNKSHIGGATTIVPGGHGQHIEIKRGTAVELWQAAIAKNPDIVDRYGEFSGQLLRAMLGVAEKEHTRSLAPASPKEKIIEDTAEKPISSGLRRRNSLTGLDQVVTLDEKNYSNLAPEVQNIIAAGKVGLPVKSCVDLNSPSLIDTVVTDDGDGAPPQKKDSKFSLGALEFEVDVAQMELDSSSPFQFPNARLIRSMRRCERKLLPLLNKWSPVDVIMTRHEIVYVDASGLDESDCDPDVREAGRQALMATKGGKGLRLCDVTAGRTVVGKLSFSDITAVHVEREGPIGGIIPANAREPCNVEFWQDLSTTDTNPDDNDDRDKSWEIDRDKRWECVNEDRLKIQSIIGTLYLRFYSDLEEMEAHPERIAEEENEEHELFKDIALQWAQTIARQCNMKDNFKQPLPQFGDENEELRYYLQIYARDEKQKGFRRAGHRRLASSRGGRHRRFRTPFSFHTETITPPGVTNVDSGVGCDSEGVPDLPSRNPLSRYASRDAKSEGPGASEDDDGGRTQSIG